jgi:DNA-directed RNA polymerase specialized sigma24 family protein
LDDPAHLSASEIRGALARLRRADIVRLSMLARNWQRGLNRRDADDLINEAFARVLAGRRPWPSDVGTSAFLSGVMRSIASQWRHEDTREVLLEDQDDDASGQVEGLFESDHEKSDLVFRMHHALGDDPQARGVLEHILADSDRDEARAELGIDATDYDTARRRMCRRMFAAFNEEWNG